MLPLANAIKYFCVYVPLVLSAINEDSPTVPALLTDYILNGNCTAIGI